MKNYINKYFNKKSGYTIPEILIVFIVIGIIFAMTMPMIINNYGEHERVSKVNKMYSIFTNALETAVARGDDYTYYNVENSAEGMKDFYDKFLKKNLNVMQECYSGEKNCWSEGDTKQMNKAKIDFGSNVMGFTLADGTLIKLVNLENSKFSSIFGVTKEETGGLAIVFDINGYKIPNTVGKDIFAMIFTVDDGIFPPFKEADESAIKSDCSKDGIGFGCTHLYIKNETAEDED